MSATSWGRLLVVLAVGGCTPKGEPLKAVARSAQLTNFVDPRGNADGTLVGINPNVDGVSVTFDVVSSDGAVRHITEFESTCTPVRAPAYPTSTQEVLVPVICTDASVAGNPFVIRWNGGATSREPGPDGAPLSAVVGVSHEGLKVAVKSDVLVPDGSQSTCRVSVLGDDGTGWRTWATTEMKCPVVHAVTVVGAVAWVWYDRSVGDGRIGEFHARVTPDQFSESTGAGLLSPFGVGPRAGVDDDQLSFVTGTSESDFWALVSFTKGSSCGSSDVGFGITVPSCGPLTDTRIGHWNGRAWSWFEMPLNFRWLAPRGASVLIETGTDGNWEWFEP